MELGSDTGDGAYDAIVANISVPCNLICLVPRQPVEIETPHTSALDHLVRKMAAAFLGLSPQCAAHGSILPLELVVIVVYRSSSSR